MGWSQHFPSQAWAAKCVPEILQQWEKPLGLFLSFCKNYLTSSKHACFFNVTDHMSWCLQERFCCCHLTSFYNHLHNESWSGVLEVRVSLGYPCILVLTLKPPWKYAVLQSLKWPLDLFSLGSYNHVQKFNSTTKLNIYTI